jgi:hypothetical protein
MKIALFGITEITPAPRWTRQDDVGFGGRHGYARRCRLDFTLLSLCGVV